MSISDTSVPLDSDLLRTFVAVAETGSITAGAARIFRSQSAASLQVKNLETLLGRAVFERHGRGVVLTPVGERLLPVARQVTALLDAALAELRHAPLAGTLRVGISAEYGHDLLSRAIARYAREHPGVDLSVRSTLSTGFAQALAEGTLDVAVYEVETVTPDMTLLSEEPTAWAGSRQHRTHERTPLPVALFDRACWWRDAAVGALAEAGRPYREVVSSESGAGVAAAIQAGIAVGVLGRAALTDELMALGPDQGFPAMPASKLVLRRRRGADSAAAQAMAAAIEWAFAGQSR